jgi:flagellar biosynthesis protein FliQ
MNSLDIGLALRASLIVIVKLAAPPLLVGLAVGVAVSLLQTVMQVNEATMTFVPKVVAVSLVLMLLGSFMVATLTTYGQLIFDQIVAVGGQ